MVDDLRLLTMQRIQAFNVSITQRDDVDASLLNLRSAVRIELIAKSLGVLRTADCFVTRIDKTQAWSLSNIKWGPFEQSQKTRKHINIGIWRPTAQCPRCTSHRTTTLSCYRAGGTRSHRCKKCDNRWKTAMLELDVASDLPLLARQLVTSKSTERKPHKPNAKTVFIEHEGTRRTLSQWAAKTGLSRHTIASRFRRGWPADRVLSPTVTRCHGTIKRVADQSVREYPWLVKTKRKHLANGQLTMVGHQFRHWTEHASKPVTAAVFHCAACGGHSVMIIGNVLKGETTCGCGRIIHGCGTGDEEPTYKRWQHLLTRAKRGEIVEPSWLRKRSGILLFIEDLGLMPGPDYYLCRRFERRGWVKGNVYWRRDVPGVFASSADDSWQLRSGFLQQVGATTKTFNKWAVFYCSLCDRHVIESRARVSKLQHSRCEQCRDAGRHIEWDGQRHTVAEWARITGLPATLIYDRLRYNWTPERILTTPQRPYRGNTSHRIDSDAMEGN